MAIKPVVLVVGGDSTISGMFENEGYKVIVEPFNPIFFPDLVCFTGGEDVSPDLYQETPLDKTRSSKRRDNFERSVYDQWFSKPKVGICRG